MSKSEEMQVEVSTENSRSPAAPGKPKKAKAKAKTKAKSNGESKPRSIDLSKRDQFGFRLGTLKSRAAIMYAGKGGATLEEVRLALKSTQFNLLTELEEKGFKIDRTPTTGENDRKITKYHILAK
jgi:hypothetical protein